MNNRTSETNHHRVDDAVVHSIAAEADSAVQDSTVQSAQSASVSPFSVPQVAFYLNDEAKQKGITFTSPREGDAGYDIRCLESMTIMPKTFKLLRTGLHIAVPQGWVALVRDRSSVALRGGVVAGGVIDASYRGEVHVLIHNFGSEALRFELGERVAQCVVVPHASGVCAVEQLSELGSTQRGAAGFGSTGRL